MKKIILSKKAFIALSGLALGIFLVALIYTLSVTTKEGNALIKLLFTAGVIFFAGCILNQFESGRNILDKAKNLYNRLDK